ncbi:hypothetical protein SDC9_40837 [bioreactor metagenome]|jgi:hypothetical protein|uniref:Glycosyltransferase RgtA/B/C/D-like domain-containing protein n=1 Tax=bioreactor metagenome TaxID=1076179 RepID=A0A644VW58_9ZZZZ|nr:hypothetical protein [Paludibacter sp.]
MKSPTIQQFIKPGVPLAVLLVLLYLVSWGLNYFFIPDIQDYNVLDTRLFEPNNFWLITSIFLLTVLNLLLIALLNNRFSIIRERSFLPVFFYALFITSWKESHFLICSHLAVSVFLISLMLFMGMYKNRTAVIPAFWGTLFISLSGILNPAYLFLIPLAWIGFVQLKCFSTRIFLASLMGMLLPWIFYFSYQLYAGNEIVIFNALFEVFQPGFFLNALTIYEQIYILALVLIVVISLFGIYTNLLSESVQNRKNINVLVFMLVFLIALVFIFPKHAPAFLPLIASLIAMLLAHPFTLQKTRFYTFLFFIVIAIHIGYMYINYFII